MLPILEDDGTYSFTLSQMEGIVRLHNQAFEDKANLAMRRAGDATQEQVRILTAKSQRSKDRFTSTMVCILASAFESADDHRTRWGSKR